jgi:hypothetical protein
MFAFFVFHFISAHHAQGIELKRERERIMAQRSQDVIDLMQISSIHCKHGTTGL